MRDREREGMMKGIEYKEILRNRKCGTEHVDVCTLSKKELFRNITELSCSTLTINNIQATFKREKNNNTKLKIQIYKSL